MTKFVRVMDGLKSNAGGFNYKLDELNIAQKWDTTQEDPELMGGFNFSTEEKVLRWTHRGDTIYDVIVPVDAELLLIDPIKGIYRSNKIIVTNPRPLTEDLVIELIDKTNLCNKILAESIQVLLWRNRLKSVRHLINTKVNKDNIDEILTEYKRYACNGKEDYNFDNEAYNMLISIKENN